MVTYTGYGVTEEVPLEYLRPLQSKKEKEASKSKPESNGNIYIYIVSIVHIELLGVTCYNIMQ